MSFRFKIIFLMLLVGLTPYIVTMTYSGSVLRDKYYDNTLREMKTQLSLTIDRLEQYMGSLQRDMLFVSRMDLMNDIYSKDIDRRISNLLQEKKKELNLTGDFYILDNSNKVIASSDANKIFKNIDFAPFIKVDVISSLDGSKIGVFVLDFSLKNLTNFFDISEERHYYLISDDTEVLYKTQSFKNNIQVSKHLNIDQNIQVVLEQDKDIFLNMLEKYENLFIVALLIGALIIGSVSYYLVDKLIKPIIKLSKVVEEITKSQDYTKDIDVKHRDDEIGKLSKAFQNMLNGINEALNDNKKLTKEIEDTQKEVVFTMGAIGESRSKETGNHVKRVAEYSKVLAKLYGLGDDEAEMLKQASPMHDIGKVAIPDAILNKPGRFTDEEFEYMKKHAELGYEMLKHSDRELLKSAAIVAYEHHEKWDGSGYPRGICGEDIHIYGRITALADVFDALGSDRVYKKAWDDEKIFDLFRDERGRHFDPTLVDLFFGSLDEFLAIREKFKD